MGLIGSVIIGYISPVPKDAVLIDSVRHSFIYEKNEMPEHVEEYFNRFIGIAYLESEKFGIPVSIKMGQAMLESGYGKSRIAIHGNNHFGIKYRKWNGDINSELDGYILAYDDCPSQCRFQKFKTAWASWRAHSLLLQNERYSELKGVTNYRQYAHKLQSCGYATSDTYAYKLISIIEKYNLHLYDI